MERYIALYNKKTGKLIKKILIENDIDFFRRVFLDSDEDPFMYDAYRITKREEGMINKKFSIDIDINKYDCTLECSG